ncbi:hypothetical protein D9613_010061 [Agrocybe pediades]|uniref:Uncharacterized protein n=1 Tax=Agrocybe pediades TaxID=84607 RepID=A0A8H4VQL7_9AGAR|nr:hypothetical protein D9613_010061 [Agrocybe pediades]
MQTPFERDLKDVHLVYDYGVDAHEGAQEKWRYELWFSHEVGACISGCLDKRATELDSLKMQNRVTYSIHGGPMAGRHNYQAADYQCIRPGELWQCNWLEGKSATISLTSPDADKTTTETGTVVSLVYDIPNKKITTSIAFSKGHWEHPNEAHGDKRNLEDLSRWRELAKEGIQTDRHMLSAQADIVEVFKGPGDLKPIEQSWPTM